MYKYECTVPKDKNRSNIHDYASKPLWNSCFKLIRWNYGKILSTNVYVLLWSILKIIIHMYHLFICKIAKLKIQINHIKQSKESCFLLNKKKCFVSCIYCKQFIFEKMVIKGLNHFGGNFVHFTNIFLLIHEFIGDIHTYVINDNIFW